MLEQENAAWLTYCIIFGLISLILLAQSFLYRHIIPFTLFAIITVCSHLYITFTPYYTEPDIAWRDQEPVLNQLPIASILIFGGIINWQFEYLNFINTAYTNYKRWGTLHPVIITDIKSDDSHSEKSMLSSRSSRDDYEDVEYVDVLLSPPKPAMFLGRKTLWSYILMLVIYAFAEFSFLICILAVSDPQTTALSSAICITVMSLPTILNFIAIVKTCIKCHSTHLLRMMDQIKKDLMTLFLISFLFMIIMTSTMAFSWVAYSSQDVRRKPLTDGVDYTNWIVLKAFLFYIPLFFLFLCCIFRCKNLKLIYCNQQQQHIINSDKI